MDILDKLEVKNYIQDIEELVSDLENNLDVNFDTKFKSSRRQITLKSKKGNSPPKYTNIFFDKTDYESNISFRNNLKNGISLKLIYSIRVEWDKSDKSYVVLKDELNKFIKKMNKLDYSVIISNDYYLPERLIHESTIPNDIEKYIKFIKETKFSKGSDRASQILNTIKKNPNITFYEIDEKMPPIKPWQYPLTFNEKKQTLNELIDKGMIEKIGRVYVFKRDYSVNYFNFFINIIYSLNLEDLEDISLDDVSQDIILKYKEFIKKWNPNIDMKKDILDIIKSSTK